MFCSVSVSHDFHIIIYSTAGWSTGTKPLWSGVHRISSCLQALRFIMPLMSIIHAVATFYQTSPPGEGGGGGGGAPQYKWGSNLVRERSSAAFDLSGGDQKLFLLRATYVVFWKWINSQNVFHTSSCSHLWSTRCWDTWWSPNHIHLVPVCTWESGKRMSCRHQKDCHSNKHSETG